MLIDSSNCQGFVISAVITMQRAFSSSVKDVAFGSKARLEMLRGLNKLTDAVAVTLGPKGRNVIIDQPFGGPKITKDGVTVAKAVDVEDKLQRVGSSLGKQVASTTNDVAGDGTTTAVVLVRSMFRDGCEAVSAGMNPMDLLRGIRRGTDHVLKYIDSRKKSVTSNEDIFNVATISANGDATLGRLIADAMAKVGQDGVITVADGKTLDHDLEIVEGFKFDRGYISPYFASNTKSQKVELENPYILVIDKKISSIKNILPVLEYVVQKHAALLIIAEDVESEALATLIVNKIRLDLNICAVKAPGFGEHRKNLLQDIAVLTNATVISGDTGISIDETNFNPSVLGSAKTVSITKESSLILEGAGKTADITNRTEQIRAMIKQSNSDYETEKLQERLAQLSGGVAVIKVGGASEIEVAEAKDRITDALNATRAAVKEGVVPGGGTALLYAAQTIGDVKVDNEAQRVGLKIVKHACEMPTRTIANNAGEEGAVVAGNLIREGKWGRGFNAASGTYVDMMESGIIDPTKVVKTALTDAASVASLMTTTEAAVYDKEVPAGDRQTPNLGGMGMDDY